MIHRLGPRRCIIVVDTDAVRDQWILSGLRFLGAEVKPLKFKEPILDGIWVTTYAAFTHHPQRLHACELLILDEADVAAAPKFINSVFAINFGISLGLTATPNRQDRLDIVYRVLAAPVPVALGTNSYVPTIIMKQFVNETSVCSGWQQQRDKYARIQYLSRSGPRNRWLAELIYRAWKRGRKVLGLSRYIEQLVEIENVLLTMGAKAELLIGKPAGMGVRAYRAALEEVKKSRIILATSQKGGRGLDIPDIDALVFLIPHLDGRQRVGRIMRPAGGA